MIINNYSKMRYGAKLLTVLNLLCILLGIQYIMDYNHDILCSIFGIILIITLIGNFLLIYYDKIVLTFKNKITKTIIILGYFYLINNVLAMLGMFIGNYTLSNSFSNTVSENINLYRTIYFSYFSIFILGVIIAYLNTLSLDYGMEIEKRQSKLKVILKNVLKFICYMNLFLGALLCWVILTVHDYRNFEIYLVTFSGFFAFIFLSITIFLLNLKHDDRNRKSYYLASILGIIVSIICALPILLNPYNIVKAEESFCKVFGVNWENLIDHNAEKYFLKRPFSIPKYFFGIESNNFLIKRDIMFYEGEDRYGKNIKLYFDVYFPKNYNKDLPGNGSTIIRIHGGAWVAGDKGKLNVLQMNKYLAQQGYTVFDIQYGLSNNSDFTMELGEPEYVKGNFTVDDMVKHIGLFTKYLEKNAHKYNANLNSLFISGGSAGGHLAAVTALGISSGKYTNVFSDKFNVKGIILFYPANGLSKLGGLYGDERLLNPALLVKKNSPPCLIYQGTRDSLVPLKLSEEFKKTYELNNNKCILMKMALGSHGSDYYFSGQYSQVFLYYMERFLYINK